MPARRRSPRRCCSPPARSPAWDASRTATPSATSTPRSRSARSRCRCRVAPFEHDGLKINLIDAPGYADFVGDVGAALRAADLAIFVVSAVEGVEVQTEAAWRIAEELGMPRAIFVNKLDRERASFERTLDELKEKFGAGVAPLELPIGEEAGVPRRDRPAHRRGDHLHGHPTPRARTGPVPDDMATEEHAVHDALVEGIVVADDDLMERYLDDEQHQRHRARARPRQGHRGGERVPGAAAEARRS